MEHLSAHDYAIAGLLHDVGKFWQRAAARSSQPRPLGYEGFSKTDFGQNGTHATWSASYLETYLPQLKRLIGAVLFHHNPQDQPAYQRLALADHLASGERVSNSDDHPPALLSIFTQVGENRPPAYLPLQPLGVAHEILFPLTVAPGQADYQALWETFAQESAELAAIQDVNSLLSSVYYLMERYTWCIPAAYYHSLPDISLFDHSRVTAAIAACLAALNDETIEKLHHLSHQRTPDASVPVAYLLEGDISGVQKFIYTLTARGAASALRGRSFYLQLLTDGIARYVLRWLNLPLTNLIYAGGGHFYMLIPADAASELPSIQQQLDLILLAQHDGDLYVALGATHLTCQDFQGKYFAAKWGEAGREVGKAKRRRFASLAAPDLFEKVFKPKGHGGNEDNECQVCHYEGGDVVERPRSADDDTPIRKCAMCAGLETLGRDLRGATHLALLDIEPLENPKHLGWENVLAKLGVQVYLHREDGHWTQPKEKVTPQGGLLLGLQDFPSLEEWGAAEQRLACPLARGLRLNVNVVPRRTDGEIATFEDLQEGSLGLKRLGVLRMDMDNLGELFSQGFKRSKGENYSTLARVASLSGNLARFFEGWVGELCRQFNEKARYAGQTDPLYTIYSGGDDLFIVGAWHILPELARQINRDLSVYASGNPLVHVSGGLSLHGGKEPLYQAAEMAHEALDAAKEVKGKNAFSMFGKSLPWSEFEVVRQQSEDLEALITKGLDRSVLRLLLELHAEYEDTVRRRSQQLGKKQVVWGAYMWHAAYLLSRLEQRSKGEHIQKAVRQILNDLEKDNFSGIEGWGLAARWTEARTRT